jgi:hypothetical protein
VEADAVASSPPPARARGARRPLAPGAIRAAFGLSKRHSSAPRAGCFATARRSSTRKAACACPARELRFAQLGPAAGSLSIAPRGR